MAGCGPPRNGGAQRRRVPEDVSVVGFDDIAAAAWPSYSLTTFRQPVNRMIEETLRILAERIASPQRGPATVLVPGRLIRRGSARLAVPASGAETTVFR